MDTGRGTLGHGPWKRGPLGHRHWERERETLRHGHWKKDTRIWTLARDTRARVLEEGH